MKLDVDVGLGLRLKGQRPWDKHGSCKKELGLGRSDNRIRDNDSMDNMAALKVVKDPFAN